MKTKLIAIAVALLLGAVGTVVVLRYVNSADARAMAGMETTKVLIATAPIAAGTPAEELAELVEIKAVPAVAAVDGRVMDLDELAGQHSVVDLVAGEQLLPSQFRGVDDAREEAVEIPAGFVEITVLLDSHRALGGVLRPGDTVSTFLSFVPKKDDQPNLTHLTFSQILVTEVTGAVATAEQANEKKESAAAPEPVSSEPAADKPAAAPGVPLHVTFAARAAEAETIVFAAEHGTIWLARDSTDVDLDGTRVVTPMNVYAIDPATIGATP